MTRARRSSSSMTRMRIDSPYGNYLCQVTHPTQQELRIRRRGGAGGFRVVRIGAVSGLK
jgi:hypothetical protein